MENVEETTTVSTISHLIHRALPLTAASSLVASRPISTSNTHTPKNSRRRKPSLPTHQEPNVKTLKPLKQRTLLVGTLALPSFADLSSPIKCSCFQFSDGTATVCCDVLDFDQRMIGNEIRIQAWNFIPLKCSKNDIKSGFLEIITWGFSRTCGGQVCSLLNCTSFCMTLGSCGLIRDDSKTGTLIFGNIESISPIYVVPCASGGTSSRNISGFLVSVLVCQCQLCASKLVLKDLIEEKNVKDHCFSNTAIVYFCGLTSSWHPVVSRFLGTTVLLTGLKKRLVYIKKEESQLMYVTTDEVSLHISKSCNERGLTRNNKDVIGKGECGTYTGIVTNIYMQGMVLELDQDVMLLLTSPNLSAPHGVRVGAIVTLKNVHFVDPRFSWGKMLILGACSRTSVHVESFSPLETTCHLKSHSQSLLHKFIDSLPFAPRLWALLVVSGFRKIFSGILSEKDILGSKHKEGLAQKYASSHLRVSAFQCRQGLMLEFCKHDICCKAKDAHYGHLRLVLPIANLISYCEASWKKHLDEQGIFYNFVGCTVPKNSLSCGGRTYLRLLRRVLCTEEIGVIVLGKIKFSSSSGRLQLVDATGEIDIMVDLPSTWDLDSILEAKDPKIVMEGMPPKLVNLDSNICQALSCRSIFTNALPLRKRSLLMYLHHHKSGEDSRTSSLLFDCKEDSWDLGSGKYHLLMLTHKFPVQQKFHGDLAKGSHYYAEAVILPCDLFLDEKYKNTVMENFSRPKNHLTHNKKCKLGHDGSSGQFNVSCSNSLTEVPCLISSKGSKFHGMLVCGCKLSGMRVLLEFGPDSFFKYEVLKISCFYLVKHREEDIVCSIKENYQESRAKVNISSGTHLRSFTFSSNESLQSCDEVLIISKDYRQFEIPRRTGNHTDSDIHVFVTLSDLNLLEKFTKVPDKQDIHDRVEPVISITSKNPCSDYHPLPVGDLITLGGLVVDLHDCNNGDACPRKPGPMPGEGYMPMSFLGNCGVCVHVLVDKQMVRIFCDPSKRTYPVGLGRDAHATFHRILVLRRQNKYMMIPVSFITINDTTSLMNDTRESENAYKTGGLVKSTIQSPDSTINISTTLISDAALQFSEPKLMQFRCRVVAVYILVVEKGRTTSVFDSSVPTIPFAGFVMDDGSSSCCCWADSGRAATLLGLEPEEGLLEDSAETLGKKGSISQLNQTLEQHGRIVVKNYGSLFDSLRQDLAFSDGLISRLDEEDLVRSWISNAILSTSWIVGGSVMDPKQLSWLEERLSEVGMTVPSLTNIWATRVEHTDVLAEARNIMQGLTSN